MQDGTTGLIGRRCGSAAAGLLEDGVLLQPHVHPRGPKIRTRIPPLAHAWIREDYSYRIRVKHNVFIIDHTALAILQDRVKSSHEHTDEEPEPKSLLDSQGRIGLRTSKVHVGVLSFDQSGRGAEDALCQLADAVGTYRFGILSHLECEVGESCDDRDATDEVSKISEGIENCVAPTAAMNVALSSADGRRGTQG